MAYQGTAYHGWQAQKHAAETVQYHLERALAQVAARPVSVVCAGRTDAGVHACGQIVHLDPQARRNAQAWVAGTNHHLPRDIVVSWAGSVAADFHARFSALARTYRYYLLNTPTAPAIAADTVTWIRDPLDADRMDQAIRHLTGEHDFTSFRGADCQSRTAQRRIHDARVWRSGDRIVIELRANAFLHNMVRNIVGSLLQVGRGRWDPARIRNILLAQDRRSAGPTAPPSGLYLMKVEYPATCPLPELAADPPHLGLLGPTLPPLGTSRSGCPESGQAGILPAFQGTAGTDEGTG